MLKYLLLLQILCVGEIFSFENFPSFLENRRYSEKSDGDSPFANYSMILFEQKIDHFQEIPSSNHIRNFWLQEVYTNDHFYKPGGPKFLVMDTFPNPPAGYWMKLAERFEGKLHFLLHRYYGHFMLLPNTTTEYLKYLNTEQALADAANFISKTKTDPEEKWIALGAISPLAAWLRLKYPHLVNGAVASSARLDAQPHGYYDYHEIVEEGLKNYNEECASAVNDAFVELNELWNNQSTRDELRKDLCPEDNDKSENNALDGALLNYIFASRIHLNMLTNLCEKMRNETLGTPFRRIMSYNKWGDEQSCVYYRYDQMTSALTNYDWEFASGRANFYQSITEFGFIPVPKPTSPIKYNLELFTKMASDVFGPQFNHMSTYFSRMNTNTLYGGQNIKVTNVVFVQGSADPMKNLGVQKNVSSSSPLIVIEGERSASDVFAINPSEKVKAAREQIAAYINSWLEK